MDKKANKIYVNLIPTKIKYNINSYTTINTPYIKLKTALFFSFLVV